MAQVILDAKNKKGINAAFRRYGVYYSDSTLATAVKELLPPGIDDVYDPTAGAGSLLAVFGADVRKYGQELDPQQAEECSQLPNCTCAAGDTLAAPAFLDRKFNAIVANYPFSIKWTPPARPEDDPRFADAPCLPPAGRADYAFILHIWYMLAEGGTAAIVAPSGVLYRGGREGRIRRWLVERQNAIESITAVGGGHFEDTSIPVVMIVLRRGRSGTDIRITDTELGQSVTVSATDIAANDYKLSVARYIQPPPPPADRAEHRSVVARLRDGDAA